MATDRTCRRCGGPLQQAGRGRERAYCSRACQRAGECVDCGGRTGNRESIRCVACAHEHKRREVRLRVYDAITAWVRLYGEPPRAIDWSPAHARRLGQPELAERFEAGDWPYVSAAVRGFGSLSRAIEVAGFTARRVGRPKARA